MLDTKTRLVQARDAIHSLELQIEQYGIHINELGADAGEAARARAVLMKLMADLATQRKYYELLSQAGDLTVKNEPLVA
jgi:hypothetical protein